MGYFRELPDLAYQNFLSDSLSSQSYIEVKNLFRRNRIRPDLENVFTVFDKYEIREGARPDTIAEELYGDAKLDWVVLLTAGILNVRDDWPLTNQEIYLQLMIAVRCPSFQKETLTFTKIMMVMELFQVK